MEKVVKKEEPPNWAWRAAEKIINEAMLVEIFKEEQLKQRELAETIHTEFLKEN